MLLEELSKNLPYILAYSLEAVSLIRYYDVVGEKIESENLEEIISCLVELEKIRRSIKMFPYLVNYTLEREKIIMGMLLSLAKKKNISFGGLCSIFLRHFSKEALKEIVLIEDILEEFGTTEAIRWKQLLGIA